MSPITTHVLNTARGCPAAGVPVILECLSSRNNLSSKDGKDQWKLLAKGVTNADGRISSLLSTETGISKGTYRLTFQTSKYFHANNVQGFYPMVQVIFEIKNPNEHYHVPLLLSPYGYSTYRGS